MLHFLKTLIRFFTGRKPISAPQLDLVKASLLFQHWDPRAIDKIADDLSIVSYPAGKLICRQGAPAKTLYLIAAGAVRVYVNDTQGQPIALARLETGDYFGEQAILGEPNKTRNAHVESITPVTLIEIPATHLIKSVHDNVSLKQQLKKIGEGQEVHMTLSSLHFYDDLKKMFITAGKTGSLISFVNNKIIFNQGEVPDFAYLILEGEVELLFTNPETHKIGSLTLHRGQLFGEMSILANQTRHATAIAKKNLRVLAIEKPWVKHYYEQDPTIRQLLSKLQQSYQLPMAYHGVVHQFVGTHAQLGFILTNFFKLSDGRSLVSELALEKDTFSIFVEDQKTDTIHCYPLQGEMQRKIFIEAGRIVGIESLGEWPELPTVCHMLLENKCTENAWFQHFSATGRLSLSQSIKNSQRKMICDCMQVSRQTLQDCIHAGANTVEALSHKTGACTVCRCCKYRLLEMLGENPWLSAVMKNSIIHHDTIRSFEIRLTHAEFKNFLPGQHVAIQVKAGENWLERTYTISDISTMPLRITIKKEPQGLFTHWLFEESPDLVEIFVTQPQGQFILESNNHEPTICFAGGVGITPFITYVKFLKQKNNKKICHVVYCALKSTEFIFQDEFNAIVETMPNINIFYWNTEERGLITSAEIAQFVRAISAENIYICGSEGFEKTIRDALHQINFNPQKIHSEQFVHAGGAK